MQRAHDALANEKTAVELERQALREALELKKAAVDDLSAQVATLTDELSALRRQSLSGAPYSSLL